MRNNKGTASATGSRLSILLAILFCALSSLTQLHAEDVNTVGMAIPKQVKDFDPLPSLRAQLLGYWGFEETASNFVESAEEAVDEGIVYTRGASGSGAFFGGRAEVDTKLSIGQQHHPELTLAAWVKVSASRRHQYSTSSDPSYSCIFGYGNKQEHRSLCLTVDGDGNVGWVVGGSPLTSSGDLSSSRVPLDQWAHVGVAYSSLTSSIRLSINDHYQEFNWKTLEEVPEEFDSLLIGGSHGESPKFVGVIDEVYVYAAFLSQSDLRWLAAVTVPPPPPTISHLGFALSFDRVFNESNQPQWQGGYVQVASPSGLYMLGDDPTTSDGFSVGLWVNPKEPIATAELEEVVLVEKRSRQSSFSGNGCGAFEYSIRLITAERAGALVYDVVISLGTKVTEFGLSREEALELCGGSANCGKAVGKAFSWEFTWNTGVVVRANQWTHLGFSWDANQVQVFVDGREASSTTRSSSFLDIGGCSRGPVILGASGFLSTSGQVPQFSQFYGGLLDDAMFFRSALSSNEWADIVAFTIAHPLGPFQEEASLSSIVAWFSFDDGQWFGYSSLPNWLAGSFPTLEYVVGPTLQELGVPTTAVQPVPVSGELASEARFLVNHHPSILSLSALDPYKRFGAFFIHRLPSMGRFCLVASPFGTTAYHHRIPVQWGSWDECLVELSSAQLPYLVAPSQAACDSNQAAIDRIHGFTVATICDEYKGQRDSPMDLALLFDPSGSDWDGMDSYNGRLQGTDQHVLLPGLGVGVIYFDEWNSAKGYLAAEDIAELSLHRNASLHTRGSSTSVASTTFALAVEKLVPQPVMSFDSSTPQEIQAPELSIWDTDVAEDSTGRLRVTLTISQMEAFKQLGSSLGLPVEHAFLDGMDNDVVFVAGSTSLGTLAMKPSLSLRSTDGLHFERGVSPAGLVNVGKGSREVLMEFLAPGVDITRAVSSFTLHMPSLLEKPAGASAGEMFLNEMSVEVNDQGYTGKGGALLDSSSQRYGLIITRNPIVTAINPKNVLANEESTLFVTVTNLPLPSSSVSLWCVVGKFAATAATRLSASSVSCPAPPLIGNATFLLHELPVDVEVAVWVLTTSGVVSSNSAIVTYRSPATATRLVPAALPTRGAGVAVLHGRGFFKGDARCRISGSTEVKAEVINSTLAYCYNPEFRSAGNNTLELVVDSVAVHEPVVFEVYESPVIVSVAPMVGSAQRATEIRVKLTNYRSDLVVYLGPLALDCGEAINNTLRCTVPPASTLESALQSFAQDWMVRLFDTSSVAQTSWADLVAGSVSSFKNIEGGKASFPGTTSLAALPLAAFATHTVPDIGQLLGTVTNERLVDVLNLDGQLLRSQAYFRYVPDLHILSATPIALSDLNLLPVTVHGSGFAGYDALTCRFQCQEEDFRFEEPAVYVSSTQVQCPFAQARNPCSMAVSLSKNRELFTEATGVAVRAYKAVVPTSVLPSFVPQTGGVHTVFGNFSGLSEWVCGWYTLDGAVSVQAFGQSIEDGVVCSLPALDIAPPPEGIDLQVVVAGSMPECLQHIANHRQGRAPVFPTTRVTVVPTPIVSSASPSSGRVAGGTRVVLDGLFQCGLPGCAWHCHFGSISTLATWLSETSIECTSPASAEGAVKKDLTVSSFISAASSVGYSYVDRLVVRVSPSVLAVSDAMAVTVESTDLPANLWFDFTCAGNSVFDTPPLSTLLSNTRTFAIPTAYFAGITAPESCKVFVSQNGVDFEEVRLLKVVPPVRVANASPNRFYGGEARDAPSMLLQVDGLSLIDHDDLQCVFHHADEAIFSNATVVSTSAVVCTLPLTISEGNFSVGLAWGKVDISEATTSLAIVPSASVQSLTPASTPTHGAGTVLMTGTGFTSMSLCAFYSMLNSQWVIGRPLRWSSVALTCASPAALAEDSWLVGTSVNGITVLAAGEDFLLTSYVQPQILRVSPSVLSNNGGKLEVSFTEAAVPQDSLVCKIDNVIVNGTLIRPGVALCDVPAMPPALVLVDLAFNGFDFTGQPTGVRVFDFDAGVVVPRLHYTHESDSNVVEIRGAISAEAAYECVFGNGGTHSVSAHFQAEDQLLTCDIPDELFAHNSENVVHFSLVTGSLQAPLVSQTLYLLPNGNEFSISENVLQAVAGSSITLLPSEGTFLNASVLGSSWPGLLCRYNYSLLTVGSLTESGLVRCPAPLVKAGSYLVELSLDGHSFAGLGHTEAVTIEPPTLSSLAQVQEHQWELVFLFDKDTLELVKESLSCSFLRNGVNVVAGQVFMDDIKVSCVMAAPSPLPAVAIVTVSFQWLHGSFFSGPQKLISATPATAAFPSLITSEGAADIVISGSNLLDWRGEESAGCVFVSTEARHKTYFRAVNLLSPTHATCAVNDLPPGGYSVAVALESSPPPGASQTVLVLPKTTITSVTPTTVPVAGGQELTLLGQDFPSSGSLSCRFGREGGRFLAETPATPVSSTQVVCLTPPFPVSMVGRAVIIAITANGFEVATGASTVTVAEPFEIFSAVPTLLHKQQSKIIEVRGSGFTGSVFGCRFSDEAGAEVTTAPAEVLSESMILCHIEDLVSMSLTVGRQLKLWLVANGREGTGEDVWAAPMLFSVLHPVVATGLQPTIGFTRGGTTIFVEGQNIANSKSIFCKFGSLPPTKGTWLSSTRIQCISPAAVGPMGVEVFVTVNGRDFEPVPSKFHYVLPPTIDAMTPSSGSAAGGTMVTIKGSFLSPPTSLSAQLRCVFGGVHVKASQVASGKITCKAPPMGLASSVTVSLAWNVLETSASTATYAYTQPILASYISPPLIMAEPGSFVTVYGQGLKGEHLMCIWHMSANDSTVQVTDSSLDGTWAKCPVPVVHDAHQPVTYDVSLTNNQGADVTSRLAVGIVPVPTVVAVTPEVVALEAVQSVRLTTGQLGATTALSCIFLPDDGTWRSSLALTLTETLVECVIPFFTSPGYVWVALSPIGQPPQFNDDYYQSLRVVPSPHISRIVPHRLSLQGGVVAIHGDGFVNSSSSACMVGDTIIPSVYVSDTEVHCSVPASSVATSVPISIANAGASFASPTLEVEYVNTSTSNPCTLSLFLQMLQLKCS